MFAGVGAVLELARLLLAAAPLSLEVVAFTPAPAPAPASVDVSTADTVPSVAFPSLSPSALLEAEVVGVGTVTEVEVFGGLGVVALFTCSRQNTLIGLKLKYKGDR